MYPFNRENIICRNGNKILILIWIIGGLYAYSGSKGLHLEPFTPPRLYNQSESDYLKFSNTTWYACQSRESIWHSKVFFIANFVITFAIPLLIITVCYLLIGRKLINNRSDGNDQRLNRSGGNNDTSKVS